MADSEKLSPIFHQLYLAAQALLFGAVGAGMLWAIREELANRPWNTSEDLFGVVMACFLAGVAILSLAAALRVPRADTILSTACAVGIGVFFLWFAAWSLWNIDSAYFYYTARWPGTCLVLGSAWIIAAIAIIITGLRHDRDSSLAVRVAASIASAVLAGPLLFAHSLPQSVSLIALTVIGEIIGRRMGHPVSGALLGCALWAAILFVFHRCHVSRPDGDAPSNSVP